MDDLCVWCDAQDGVMMLVGGFAFTGWCNIQISYNLRVLWQFSDEFGVSCILHENFTEYGEFLFCGAGELSFWVKCYFTTAVATVLHSSLHDLPIGSCMLPCKNVSRWLLAWWFGYQIFFCMFCEMLCMWTFWFVEFNNETVAPYSLNDAWNACFCQVEMALGTFKEMLQQK